MTYFGSRFDLRPPPGMSRRTFREGAQRGAWPATRLPGRGGWVVSTADWDAWLRSQRGPIEDPIEADIRRRFKCRAA